MGLYREHSVSDEPCTSQISELRDNRALIQVPHHLVLSQKYLNALKAKFNKTKILYTLNAFRSIQRRICFELREMGTRDRVMGDVNYVKPH